MTKPISQRKQDHLDLAAHGEVGFRGKTTLLECVQLVHDSLPELSLDEIDLSIRVLGKRLAAPLIVAGMTGGTARARDINRELASLAEDLGYGFGLGSQRAMLEHPELESTYAVRDCAPNALLLGNLGAVQARSRPSAEIESMLQSVGADALCLHLNPAMEVVQAEGDRDFRGIAETIERLIADLSVPVVVKETGCGISDAAARRLAAAGVRHVDVSGAGGTSWVGVEAMRDRSEAGSIGETFWDWGIPTAASLLLVAPWGFRTVIATGGIKTGLDAARALCLGAHAVGIARPLFQALERGGPQAARDFMQTVERELRATLLLSGCRSIPELRCAPHLIVGELSAWNERARRLEPSPSDPET